MVRILFVLLMLVSFSASAQDFDAKQAFEDTIQLCRADHEPPRCRNFGV